MKHKLLNAAYQAAQVFRFSPREVRVMKLAVRAVTGGKICLAEKLCRSAFLTDICWEYASRGSK